jgi:hypothetical protein
MKLTLPEFLRFLHGLDGTDGSKTVWVTQKEAAYCINRSPDNYNKLLHKKRGCSPAVSDDIFREAENIIRCCLTPKGAEAEKALSFCRAMRTFFTLPPEAQRDIDIVCGLGIGTPEERKAVAERFTGTLTGILRRLCAGGYADGPKRTPAHGSIPEECKKAFLAKADAFATGIYLELHEKTENIVISVEENTCTRHIVTRAKFVNPAHEAFSYRLRQNTVPRGLTGAEHIRKRYGGLKIRIDGRDLSDFVRDLTERYPLMEAPIVSVFKNRKDKTPDIYSAFSYDPGTVVPGEVSNTVEMLLEIPTDPNARSVTVETEYTSTDILDFDSTAYIFRLGYPCRHLLHRYTIEPKGQWGLNVSEFTPFYRRLGDAGIGKFATVYDGLSTAVIDINDWSLPGTGYVRRCIFHKATFG